MRYPQEICDWIAENAPGHYRAETVEKFNASDLSEKYGIKLTVQKLKSFLYEHGLRTGMRTPKGARRYTELWPEEISLYLEDISANRTAREVAKMINEKYGTSYTNKQVVSYRANHHLNCGGAGAFQKGNVPWNKGMKGLKAPGIEKGWFKKGDTPANTLPIGSEIVNIYGYHKIKIGHPNYWMWSARYVYMQHHGDIPDGYKVIFADGDRHNLSPENLVLVSDSEALRLIGEGLRFKDSDLTKAGVNLLRLKMAIEDIERANDDS